MSSSRSIYYSASRRARRFLIAVSLVAYLASVWGYPLPQAATHDPSVPFPCQDHRCGCVSAEQCWTSCCCFTPAERIAWAERHHVQIPAQVQLALRAEAAKQHTEHRHDACDAGEICRADDHDHDDHDGHDHDTDHQHAANCDGHGHNAAGAERACEHCTPRTIATEPETSTSIVWVSAFEARKCRGLSTLWIVTGAAVPLAIESLWEFDWAPAGQAASAERKLQSVTSLPTVPPPRV
jgi:hypothetical protein